MGKKGKKDVDYTQASYISQDRVHYIPIPPKIRLADPTFNKIGDFFYINGGIHQLLGYRAEKMYKTDLNYNIIKEYEDYRYGHWSEHFSVYDPDTNMLYFMFGHSQKRIVIFDLTNEQYIFPQIDYSALYDQSGQINFKINSAILHQGKILMPYHYMTTTENGILIFDPRSLILTRTSIKGGRKKILKRDTMVLKLNENTIIAYGGNEDGKVFDDIWLLNLDTLKWRKKSDLGYPLDDPQGVIHNNTLWIYGSPRKGDLWPYANVLISVDLADFSIKSLWLIKTTNNISTKIFLDYDYDSMKLYLYIVGGRILYHPEYAEYNTRILINDYKNVYDYINRAFPSRNDPEITKDILSRLYSI